MKQRRSEYASLLDFHAPYGGFHKYTTAGTLEGGDIHIIRPGLLVLGYSGVRTDEAGARQFAGCFTQQGWEVRLVPFPAHFLHLDVLFCMATPYLAVACIDVLGEEFCTFLAEPADQMHPRQLFGSDGVVLQPAGAGRRAGDFPCALQADQRRLARRRD